MKGKYPSDRHVKYIIKIQDKYVKRFWKENITTTTDIKEAGKYPKKIADKKMSITPYSTYQLIHEKTI